MSFFTRKDFLVVCLCIILHLAYKNNRRRRLPFPPGPWRWPILKNTLTVPLSNAHGFYKDLGEQLGSKLLYLEALGQSILVINDVKTAEDLLGKRSALYSSRPTITMLQDIVSMNTYFAFKFMPYGDEWRSHRRMFQQHFAEKYLPRDQAKIIGFVRKGLLANLLESPGDFEDHIRNCVGGLSISLTYGIPVQRKNDPVVHMAEKTLSRSMGTAGPGKYMVNIVPALKYWPEWMPGSGFKQEGKEIRKDLERFEKEPFQATLQMMESGSASPCFVVETLEKYSQDTDYELLADRAKYVAAMVFAAFSETTIAAIDQFLLAMLKRPEVMEKAQQELESVVSGDRLPEFSDLQNLPYLSAVIKETFRWNPIAPMGVPHTTSEEDVYMGYYIPKGCTVFANSYAMLHDETVFPESREFRPERFMKDGIIREDLPDPEVIATFGFGRRTCPGAHVAKSTLYIAVASILHLFDVKLPVDADGNIVPVEPRFDDTNVIAMALPFDCRIIPRKDRDVHGLLKEYVGNDPM